MLDEPKHAGHYSVRQRCPNVLSFPRRADAGALTVAAGTVDCDTQSQSIAIYGAIGSLIRVGVDEEPRVLHRHHALNPAASRLAKSTHDYT